MINEEFTGKQIEVIKSNYGLNIESQTLPDWKTATNHVVILKNADGTKNVAKQYSNEYPIEVIKSRLRIMNFMYDHGIQTPHLLENKNGANVTIDNGNYYTVTTHIKGEKANKESSEEISLAFSGLARFNNTLTYFNRLNEFRPLKRYSGISLKDQFNELLSYLPKKALNKADAYVLSKIDGFKRKSNR